MHYCPHMLDNTISTISHSNGPGDAAMAVADELIVLLECDRPHAGSSCHRLGDIDEVVIARGATRQVERSDGRLVVRIPDGRISTVHAFLRRDGASFFLHDAGSKNGVAVNGARVDRHLLRDRDVIECGHTTLVFRVARARPVDAPADVDYADIVPAVPGLLTLHAPLAAQFRALGDVATSSIPILVLGPSGTGKELVARGVHALAQRRGSFVGVNCGALPENLVEAELFGSRRGAFTGANEDRVGLVRSSDQGTLFLDEIGDLPLRAQPTLLRALQEREVMPVGATRPVPVDLRLVAATHHDLDALAKKQQFRPDLLARISGFIVKLPPLRERIEDFGILIGALLARHAAPPAPAPKVSIEAMRALLRYDWPLNIRELEYCLRAALALSPSRIDLAHLPDPVRNPPPAPRSFPPAIARSSRDWTPEQLARREELRALLVEHRWNISQVARVMGKDRVQVRRWIRLFGLSEEGTAR
ncbi:MAG: Response regulator of zinc sigma-54-dependent two-component system [Myxococcales bacterium]|nr:Response regulator of zinc sigma-54-dependent two-component system [Myxococcales bacterium]